MCRYHVIECKKVNEHPHVYKLWHQDTVSELSNHIKGGCIKYVRGWKNEGAVAFLLLRRGYVSYSNKDVGDRVAFVCEKEGSVILDP